MSQPDKPIWLEPLDKECFIASHLVLDSFLVSIERSIDEFPHVVQVHRINE